MADDDDEDYTYSLEVSRLPGSYNTGDRDNTLPVAVAWVRGGYLFHKYRGREPAAVEAYVYLAKLVRDYDGSPTAYGWDRPDSDFKAIGSIKPWHCMGLRFVNLQKNLQPLESRGGQQVGLANAASPWQNLWHGHDFKWVGVVSGTPEAASLHDFLLDDRPPLRDRNGKFPIVQPEGAPAPGYYVSQNPTIVDKSKPWWDQRRYADGNTFPYAVLPSQFQNLGCFIGDVGLAIRPKTGRVTPFVFGDTGTVDHLGEVSAYLYDFLTEGGGNSDYMTFLAFPNSGFRNTEGLSAQGAVEFRASATIATIGGRNATDLPLLMALGGDIPRFQQAQKRIASGRETAAATPGYAAMLSILVNYGLELPTA